MAKKGMGIPFFVVFLKNCSRVFKMMEVIWTLCVIIRKCWSRRGGDQGMADRGGSGSSPSNVKRERDGEEDQAAYRCGPLPESPFR